MNRHIVSMVLFACVAAEVPGLRAQSTQATAPTQSTQSSAPNPAQQPASNASPADKTEKKVWTNDDVGDLRDHAPISTIGNNDPKSTKTAGKPAATPPSKNREKWYVDQIHTLQAKIPPLDDQIQRLQAALNGDQVNSTRVYGGVKPDDWRDQVQRLQKQRDDLEAKIRALEDQARHDGVPPNMLPQQ